MKHALIVVVALVFCVTSVFAADFAPTLLKLSAADVIQYDFDGSKLKIPVTISGTPAYSVFFVYTKDKAAEIAPMQNGYLGWHFVNKVDTCMYMSTPTQFSVGSNTLVWDGKDNDGNLIPAGEYTYYLWGYDNVNQRLETLNVIGSTGEDSLNVRPTMHTQIIEKDEYGNPLANPLFTGNWFRWRIGSDPYDGTMLETVKIPFPSNWKEKKHYAVQQDDLNIIYVPLHNPDASTGGLWKYKWVPNGDAELMSDWGESGAVTWTQPQKFHMNAVTDGNFVYVTANTYKEDYVHNELWVVNYEEGALDIELDISEFWGDPDDFAAGAQMNGGPGTMTGRDHLLFLGCHGSCLKQVMDPMRGLDNEDDLVVYVNDNGDYVLDHNFEEDADKPWVCNDFNVGPYAYTYYSDAEYFTVCPAYDMGAVSFGALAPDGTGIGYFAFIGETSNKKQGVNICDNGSAFDGYYTTKTEAKEIIGKGTLPGTWYSAHDAISGILTSAPLAVEEDAPAAFAVAQNSPNPFNPSTTISFTLAEAGNVAIDVFNVAGQKVDTIASEFMGAGSHSITWDASEFSAGVYFYTVKSGDFTKTMKMTLLK